MVLKLIFLLEGTNLSGKYLSIANNLSTKSTSKVVSDTESSSNEFNNINTISQDTLNTFNLPSPKAYTKLPELKKRISMKNFRNNQILEKIKRSNQNLVVTNSSLVSGEAQPQPQPLQQQSLSIIPESTEYYNHKIRLIAKLMEKNESNLNDKSKTSIKNAKSSISRKSKKMADNNLSGHFTASFPTLNQPHNNGLNPTKTTKLDRQFKRVIHIDHNKRFTKPVANEKPINTKAILKYTKLLNNHLEAHEAAMAKNEAARIKFPNLNTEFDDKSDIFTSSSFVQSEAAFKDTIKS